MHKALAAFLLLAVSALAAATEFTIDPVSIHVPAGFDGPIEQHQGTGTVVTFARSSPDSVARTALQITIFDLGHPLQGDLATASRKYLMEFLEGVARRRSNFMGAEPTIITLDGFPAAKTQWTGKLEDIDTHGVIYCFVVGSRVIGLHVVEPGNEASAAMKEAIGAIESLRVSRGG